MGDSIAVRELLEKQSRLVDPRKGTSEGDEALKH
jgi:hypothetical protein